VSFYRKNLMTTKQKLIQRIKDQCLEFGSFTLKSGKKSKFYLDLRRLTLSTGVSDVICELEWRLQDLDFDAIGGPALGAVPIVGAFLHNSLFDRPVLRGFAVRSEEKDHGKAGLIIGSVQPGDSVVAVEDVTTTGGSLLGAVDAIQEFGCTVIAAYTVLDRLEGAEQAFADRKIPFHSLATVKDIVPAEYLNVSTA
jgi:orotate phosphoribosyltransferase